MDLMKRECLKVLSKGVKWFQGLHFNKPISLNDTGVIDFLGEEKWPIGEKDDYKRLIVINGTSLHNIEINKYKKQRW